MIYTLSKNVQHGEEESYDSAMGTVVKGILNKSGLQYITINNRIINSIQSHIYTLQAKIRAARKNGRGRLVNKVLNDWKSPKNYRFKIYYSEVDTVKLQEENSELKTRKRKLEDSLIQEKVQKLKVEEKLTDALKRAGKQRDYYKKNNSKKLFIKRQKCKRKQEVQIKIKHLKIIPDNKGQG